MALDKNVAKKFIGEWIHSDKNKNDWFSTNPCSEISLPMPEEPITRKVLFEKTNKNNWEYIGMQFIETHLKSSADDMINSMFLSMYSQKIASEMHIDIITEKIKESLGNVLPFE